MHRFYVDSMFQRQVPGTMPLHFFTFSTRGQYTVPNSDSESRRVLRSIKIDSDVVFFFHINRYFWQKKITAWAYGALQLRRRHFLISRTRNTKLTYVVELCESFPTIQNLGVEEPPLRRNLGSKLKTWPPISPPPRGLQGQFWYLAMRDP